MKLTKEEKNLLIYLLDRRYAVAALDYDASENENKLFKKTTGFTIKQAEKIMDKLVEALKD